MTTTMKARFEDKAALVEALRAQKIVQGDEGAARAIAAAGELVEFEPGALLIEQGESDRSLFFLLAGQVAIIVQGSVLYPRERNSTVGEMSAINPELTRAASVRADKTTVAWRISHQQLVAAADAYPRIWRLMAVEMASRLEQRNQFIAQPNSKPAIFIISSAEALDIAEGVRLGLEHEVATTEIWSDEQIFPPGSYPLDALQRHVAGADFGIAIAQPDDLVRSRDRTSSTPRDNVIFELGFFMSALGRGRTLLLIPKGPEVKLPSDFKGLTPLVYKVPTGAEKLSTALGPTVTRIKAVLREHGVRRAFGGARS